MSVPQTTNSNDIATVIANLASRQGNRPKGPPMSGPKRAAILMLALGEQYGGKVWSLLDDDEVRELSMAMSTLGTVEADVVEDLLLEFVSRMSASGALMGTFDATERLLQQYLPTERVTGIMDEIRGPAGRNMWEKLSNVQEEVLANYLKNEYPQTIAVVLSKLKPEHAARVLAILPEDMALDVVGVDAILTPDGDRLDTPKTVPAVAHATFAAEQVTRALVGRTVADVERDLILETLKDCLGNRTHAANILGISIRTLRNKLNEYADGGLPITPAGASDYHRLGATA
jgi:FliG N-terminal domain/FliG middle domain/Bacterial regulatory protein, Fis family